MFLPMFLSAFVFSAVFHPGLARSGLSLNLNVNNSNSVLPISYLEASVNIVVHDLVFLSEVFLGSFFLVIPAFIAIFYYTLT